MPILNLTSMSDHGDTEMNENEIECPERVEPSRNHTIFNLKSTRTILRTLKRAYNLTGRRLRRFFQGTQNLGDNHRCFFVIV